jgi:hypothetical protein
MHMAKSSIFGNLKGENPVYRLYRCNFSDTGKFSYRTFLQCISISSSMGIVLNLEAQKIQNVLKKNLFLLFRFLDNLLLKQKIGFLPRR